MRSQLFKSGVLMSLVIILVLMMAVSMTVGEFNMTFINFFKTLLGFGSAQDELVLFSFRLPRLLVVTLAGGALALSGMLLQTISRNPLADPGILGINAGSGLFIVLLLLFIQVDSNTFIYVLPLFSLIGGLLTALLIFFLSYKRAEGINAIRMILIGVGLSTALSGTMVIITSTFNKERIEFISAWLGGNIWGDLWPFAILLSISVFITIPFVYYKSNVLNILSTHEQIATSIGINVQKERTIAMLLAVILSATAVAVCGAIGFIGLLAPHIARQLVGPKHQTLIPTSILIGAILLSFSDIISKTITNIPTGIIVSIIGAPYFIYLMKKQL